MQVTIAPFQIPHYQGGGTVAYLRIHADVDFVTSDGVPILHSASRDEVFYKEVACTVVGTDVLVPSFVLDSTRDSTAPTEATYSAYVHDGDQELAKTLFRNYFVPSDLGTTLTLQELTEYNLDPQPYVDPVASMAYSTVQSDARFLHQNGNENVTGIKSFLDSPTGPDPTTAQQFATKNYADTAGTIRTMAALTAALAVIGANPAAVVIGGDIAITTAVTIPSNVTTRYATGGKFTRSGGGSLIISGPLEVPRVKFFYGFTSSYAAGVVTKNLTLKGPQWEYYPEWTGAAADYTVGTGTDSSAPVQLLLDAIEHPNIFDSYNVVRQAGGVIRFAPGFYYFTDTIVVRKQFTIAGAGRESTMLTFVQNKTGFICHGNQTENNAYGTPQASSAGTIFQDLEIHSLGGGATTHTVDIAADLKMTRTAGVSFLTNDLFGAGRSVTIGSSEWQMFGGSLAPTPTADMIPLGGKAFMSLCGPNEAYMISHDGEVENWWVGATVDIAGNSRTISSSFPGDPQHNHFGITPDLPYAMFLSGAVTALAAAVNIGTDTITLPSHGFNTGDSIHTFSSGTSISVTGIGSPVTFYDGLYVIRIDANTFKVATSYANAIALSAADITGAGTGTHTFGIYQNYQGVCTITAITPRTGVAVRLNTFSGIRALMPITVQRVRITDCAGNGIDFSSVGQPNNGTEPNVNNSIIRDVQSWRNLGSGLYFWGTNSNNCTVELLDAQVNRIYGVFDYSFLGNNYYGCHTSSNLQGAYTTLYAGTTRSTFRDCYAEADQPPIYLGQYAHWSEGNPGCGFRTDNQGTVEITNGAAGRVDFSAIGTNSINGIDPATFAILTAIQTLTNKRIQPRVVTVAQSATPTINTDNTDVASITGLAQAITSMTTNLTGTPVAGEMLVIEITDNGTARAITWGAKFEASTVALPTTTVINTKLTAAFSWNAATSKWRCVGVA